MSRELTVECVYEGGMAFSATTGEHTVCLDYPMQPGELGTGPTPLQMVLASLASCSGSTLALVLARMGKTLSDLRVTARGLRRDEHPTVLTEVELDFVLKGDGLDSMSVERALRAAEEKLCPVWAMLKGGTPITAHYRIVEE